MTDSAIVDRIEQCLLAKRFRYSDEEDLQAGIAQTLAEAAIPFAREVHLIGAGRIDFLVDWIGIEVKTKGSRIAVTRQLYRYAANQLLSELMLVTTRAQHRGIPETILGKKCRTVWLCGL